LIRERHTHRVEIYMPRHRIDIAGLHSAYQHQQGPFMREAHEETSDRMKSARVGILILVLVICGAVKPRSTENLVGSAAAAAEPKPPDHATKVKGANEINRRLMSLSEEDRRSVFRRILALAKERCVEITRTFYQQQAKQWNVRCRGGPSYVIEVEAPKAYEGD
jgi:hypothetical protein